ncbi:MAG: FkbM family methyltransferase [Betaproteobacteria bacterium]
MKLIEVLRVARKSLLTRASRPHWSQYGEDCVLADWLARQRDGFYVDVGAYHPRKGSNTHLLRSRGWRGMNIDLDAAKIMAFRLLRPADVNIVAAVSDRTTIKSVYTDKWYSTRATLNPGAGDGEFAAVGEIRTTTLTTLLDESRFRDRPIDLLNVDVEGEDVNVLRGLDFERYRPALILVERLSTDIDEILGSELHVLLTQFGYRLANWVGFTLFYRRAMA